MKKILLCRFKQCFGHFNMLAVHKFSDRGLFRHLSNPAFCSLKFQKHITSEDHILFKTIPIFKKISEMQKKIEKIFFHFEIIAFELVPLDTCF